MLDLCADLPERSFAAGDVLFEDGTTSSVMYILIEGELEVCKGGVRIRTVSEPGALFGEVAALLGIPHTATVRALTAGRVHTVDDPGAFLRSRADVTYGVAELLAQRLHSLTTYLVDLKRQYEDHEGHLSIVDQVLETLSHHQREKLDVGSDRDPDPTL